MIRALIPLALAASIAACASSSAPTSDAIGAARQVGLFGLIELLRVVLSVILTVVHPHDHVLVRVPEAVLHLLVGQVRRVVIGPDFGEIAENRALVAFAAGVEGVLRSLVTLVDIARIQLETLEIARPRLNPEATRASRS